MPQGLFFMPAGAADIGRNLNLETTKRSVGDEENQIYGHHAARGGTRT